MSNFEALGLMPELIEAVEEMGWSLPSAVQDDAIPLILGGADVMIAAETGSGKTGAFCLPLLQLIYEALHGTAQVTSVSSSASSFSSSAPSLLTPNNTLNIILNPHDRDAICAVDELRVQTRHPKDWAGIKSNIGLFLGKRAAQYQYEATVTDEGLCRVGWSASKGSRNLGTDALSFGFGGTGKKSNGNNFNDYGESFGLNDVIGVCIDLQTRNLSFLKNGKDLGVAFEIPNNLSNDYFYPACVLKNAEMLFNFGNTPLRFPRAGYKPVCQAPLDEINKASSATAGGGGDAPSAAQQQHRPKTASSSSLLALIIEPTRELALQVYEEITKFIINLDRPKLKVDCFIGGTDMSKILGAIKSGLHIIIATPGRLNELVKSGKVDVSALKYLVLDEADQLMDVGNKNDIMSIWDKIQKNTSNNMQVVICSATLHSNEITELSEKITKNAQWVDLKGKDSVPDTVDHCIILADAKQDQSWQVKTKGLQTDGVHAGINLRNVNDDTLSEGIKLLKPQILVQVIDQFKMDQCLIFVRTQLDCDNLEEYLVSLGGGQRFTEKAESGKENPYSCVVLHGGRSPPERARNLHAFKEGDVRFLICTDVAARGIDIKNLPYVINVTLPDKPETYIHRIGRVGRADAIGLAISIVATSKEKVWWHNCNRPDRGRGCTRTQLTSQGGCTVWFDEMDMLRQIEGRLGNMSIPHLDRSNLLKGAQFVIEQASKGRKKADDGSIKSEQHVQVLKPTVEELSRLEVNAQYAYLTTRHSNRWAQMLKAGGK